MKIQADINLGLALTNTTISTQEVQGAFPVDEYGEGRWISQVHLLKRGAISRRSRAGGELHTVLLLLRKTCQLESKALIKTKYLNKAIIIWLFNIK